MTLGKKYDRGKTRYDLVPRDSYKAWADVLTFGANKYGDDNWKKLDRLQDRYYAAAVRHIEAYRAGEATDEESGLPHLAHAITCLSFMLEDSYVRSNRTMDGISGSRDEVTYSPRGINGVWCSDWLSYSWLELQAHEEERKKARAKTKQSD